MSGTPFHANFLVRIFGSVRTVRTVRSCAIVVVKIAIVDYQ